MPSSTVLLAEPDSATRTAVRSRLEENGFTVLEAPSGVEALSMANKSEIALVISELYLEAGKDRCLVQAIRHAPALRRTRVLAFTRHAKRADRDWAVNAGADGYVIKASGQDRLVAVVNRLASRTQSRTEKLRNARTAK